MVSIQDEFNDELGRRLKLIKHLALDLDGTLYLGLRLLDATSEFLSTLERLGIGRTYLTNNSSKSGAEYVAKLEQFGIVARAEDVYTSAHATVHYLESARPEMKRLFVVGTAGLKHQFMSAGFTVCDEAPDAVVVGLDTGLTYDRLAQAAYWIKSGIAYLATHPDLMCPTDERKVLLPDCGAICQLLNAATGRRPDAVLGKPDVAMINGIRNRYGLSSNQIGMVGDRLYTDVQMAVRADVLGVLVLTGETSREDLVNSQIQPDVLVEDVGQLGKMLLLAHGVDGR